MTTGGLEPYHDFSMFDVDVSHCLNCCLVTSSTSPHWSLISCVLGRFGSLRAQVGLGFAVVGWFRRVRLPPLRWSWSVSVGLRISFPYPFRVCPFWPRCVVLVFSLHLFFCVPLLVSRLSICHLSFIFISFSLPFISLSGP